MNLNNFSVGDIVKDTCHSCLGKGYIIPWSSYSMGNGFSGKEEKKRCSYCEGEGSANYKVASFMGIKFLVAT